MIIKEKRWLSRFVAMLCVLTMVVGVLTPASVGVAATYYGEKLILPINDGLEWLDEDQNEILTEIDNYGNGTSSATGNYVYSKNEEKIEIEPNGENIFNTPIILFLRTNCVPKLSIKEKSSLKITPIETSTNLYKITIKQGAFDEINTNLSLNIDIQYKVTFPEYDDTYTITLDENEKYQIDKTKRSCTVSSGESLSFTATAKDDNKELIIKANGGTLQPNKETGKYQLSINTNTNITVSLTNKTCKITEPTTVDGYKYTRSSDSIQVNYGGSFSFYVTPDNEGYNEPKVYVYDTDKEAEKTNLENQVKSSANNLYVVNGITTPKSIYIESGGQKQYTISFQGTGYTVTGVQDNLTIENNKATANYGDELKFTLEPDTGYDISSVTASNGNGIEVLSPAESNQQYTLSNVTANTVINVTVQKSLYTVKFAQNTAGKQNGYTCSVEEGVTTTVSHGDKYTFYVTPAKGYGLPKVTYKVGEDMIDKEIEPVDGVSRYEITITGNTTITIASGYKNNYTITYITTDGIKFIGADTTTTAPPNVDDGEKLSFAVEVDKRYNQSVPVVYANSVIIQAEKEVSNGSDGSKVYKYSIPDVTEKQTISVSGVKLNTYRITLETGEGYKISSNDGTSITDGEKYTFNVEIATGYDKSGITVTATSNGNAVAVTDLKNGSYETAGITGNTTIKVEGVKPITPKITVYAQNAAVKKGTEEINGGTTVTYDGSLKFTVDPTNHYRVTQVEVNGEPKPAAADGSYTINNITKDVTIKVITSAVKLTIHYVDERYPNNNNIVEYTVESENGKYKNGEVEIVGLSKQDGFIYKFDGWYDESEKKENISIPAHTDEEITLTAKWVQDEKAIKGGIELKTNGKWESQTKGDYNYKMLAKTVLEKIDELSGEYKENVSITGYGTLYSNEKLSDLPRFTDRIKAREGDYSDTTLAKEDVSLGGQRVWNFFANVDYKAGDIEIGKNDYFYLKLDSKTMETERYAVGWIELTVEETTYIIYANLVDGGKVIDPVSE